MSKQDEITAAVQAAAARGSREVHVRLADDGTLELGAAPVTWDGEPLYHPETVSERLFQLAAFEQMRGQTSLETDSDAG